VSRDKIFHALRASALMGASALILGLALLPSSAHAQNVRVGSITCHEPSGWGFIFGSTRDLACVYSPLGGGGPVERYAGRITKFGVDIGYSGAGVIVWAVFAPTTGVAPGDLAGNYVGVTGSATVGIGVGANVLLGGSNKSIMLQPVSISGETGLNVAAGVASLVLQYSP
jgi:hypothetical protein